MPLSVLGFRSLYLEVGSFYCIRQKCLFKILNEVEGRDRTVCVLANPQN